MQLKSPFGREHSPILPVAGAIIALVLALIGSGMGSSASGQAVTILCYMAAIGIFAVTAPHDFIRGQRAGSSAYSAFVRSRARAIGVLGGFILAIVLDLVGCELVYHSLTDPQTSSVTGPVLWFISLVILLGTSLLARVGDDAPNWEAGKLPGSARLRWTVPALLAALVVLAAAVRLVGLADVPHGINADEGDRTATAISILRRYDTSSIFSSGWFYISNFYFWLLAGVLKILGVGYAQARTFGAISSLVTFCVTLWIGFRHFGSRVALLTGVLGVTLAVSLQFARETTEATQTAMLWSLSVAFLLEAVRKHRPWLWVAAGISGGLSIYFYPSGRLWAVLAAGACGYVWLWTRGRERWDIVAGTALTAIAALMTVGPFFANIALNPDQLSQRAQQTSIFSGDNPTRLAYYDPHWSTLRLLWAQVEQSLGIFSRVADGGGFWPTDRPILWGLFSILLYLGIGWASISWRDPRKTILALWFWVGFVGVIITVETPNVQRMATAVPVLPLLCALVLDNTVTRFRLLEALSPESRRTLFVPVTTAVALMVAGILAWQQWNFYFNVYGVMDRWPQPTIQGKAVADQGPNALVMTVGRESHQINSGWVRLLAPNADRGGIQSPGSSLPLSLPADRDLAFVLYPSQNYYLPYLESLYPGGAVHPYRHPTEGLVVTVYRVSRAQWSHTQGALASVNGGPLTHVPVLGGLPPHAGHTPVRVSWTAQLRVPQYWNYDFKFSRGVDLASIDGRNVLAGTGGGSSVHVTSLALARGEHFVRLSGILPTTGADMTVQWRAEPGLGVETPLNLAGWHSIGQDDTTAASSPRGLLAVVHASGLADGLRLDGTPATCCLSGEVSPAVTSYDVTWRGWLTVPRSGVYPMGVFSQGAMTLNIDGHTILHTAQASDTVTRGRATLQAGRHSVELHYRVNGTSGGIEWTWTPPGEPEQIVSPLALEPPAGAGVGPPVPISNLERIQPAPNDTPLTVVQ